MPVYSPPSNSMEVFCAAVKQRLESNNITQLELANRLGTDPSALSKRLRGKHGNCTFAEADKIATALNTTTIELLASYNR